ncbi:MAG TPA: type IV pilus twitching motility protein PilT [Armatimonadota bacterium]|nr:type IV pilus twitching motility protein PilT [Armatimonadota bacterium]HQK93933.1 type IV pilus twitching motility protein PilT [Armatimonadota bacterium]
MAEIDPLLRTLRDRGGSDLHLKVGNPPIIRVDGDLTRLDLPVLRPEDTKRIMYGLLSPERQRVFEETHEMDVSYYLPDVARFRVNVFQQKGYVGGVLRLIPIQVKTIDEMGLPQVLKYLAMRPRGLMLVTGPTGSGKSTTLAAMVDYINENKAAHIITIEDPLEFLHFDKLSCLNQRELGEDTHSFAEALKHCLRQNPDVILVGEMRDLETIQLAITAAETGHLVFATLHTTDAAQTIDRIIDVFPPEQQEQIRAQLAATIEGIVCQQLLQRKGGKGRVPAFEIMLGTPAVKTLIREAKTHQVPTIIQTGLELGMVPLDQYLIGLVKDQVVDYEQALQKCSNPRDFQQRAQRVLGSHLGGATLAT